MASTRLDNAPFYYEKCMGLDSALASGLCPPLGCNQNNEKRILL